MLDNTADVLLCYRSDGILMWASPSLETTFGWRPTDVIGTEFHLSCPDDQSAGIAARSAAVDRQLDHARFRIRALCADGSLRNAEVHASFVRDATGRIELIITSIIDVTALVEAQRTVALSEERFRYLAENASDVVFLLDAAERYTWVSPSVREVFGWEPTELVGRSPLEFIHPEDHHLILGALDREFVGITFESRDVRYLCADGTYRWAAGRSRRLDDDAGGRLGRVVAVRDVHDRVLARQALAESEERLRLVLDNMGDVVVHRHRDGTVLWASPSLLKTFGWQPEDVVGTRFEMTAPADRADTDRAMTEALQRGVDTFSHRCRVVTADGSWCWADWTTNIVWGPDRSVDSFVTSLRDVTAQVFAEHRMAESEARYRLLIENTSDIVFRGNPQAVIEWISEVTEILGYEPRDMIGHPISEFLHPDDIQRMRSASTQVNIGDRGGYEARLRTKTGEYLWVAISARPIFEGGTIIGRIGTARVVQSEVEAREALARSEQRFRQAMESAPTGMALVDLDRRFVEVNPALCEMLGRSRGWLLSHGVADLLDEPGDWEDAALRQELLAGGRTAVTHEARLKAADGSMLWAEHSVALLQADDDAGAPTFVSQFINVTHARLAREELAYHASHDTLTHLINRREFFNRARIKLAASGGEEGEVAFLFLDIDGLKPVNDVLGHAIGDEVIVAAAKRIANQIHTDDVVARFGGDEFVVMLSDVRTLDDAEKIAARMHHAMTDPILAGDQLVPVTFSIGIALARPGDDPDRIIQQADSALYQAKRSGRSRTVVHHQLTDGEAARGT